MSSEAMYANTILDYYRNPRNYGVIDNASASARDVNPLCGDKLEMCIKVDNGKISDVKFTGSGCAISQASASMLTEMALGKNVEDARSMTKDDMLDMLGIQISHVRIKCALLGLKVFKLALYSYIGQSMSDEENESL